jgi:medium-chain acyl-[acyl-carrier-protein] hydrolase
LVYNTRMTPDELVFRKDYPIHTYETDVRGFVRPTALLNYLQDSAGEHAGRLGWSVPDLFKKNMTWVLSRYHLRMHRYPSVGRRLEVTTWPSGKSGYHATRDFEVADADGPVLSATSSWMIIGLEKKQPVKIDAVIDVPYAIDRRALDDPFHQLPLVTDRQAEVRFRVESAHLDWNRHVNNAVYVQWALEAVPKDVLLKSRPLRIEVAYKAEAFYGEEILSAVQRVPDEDGEPAFVHQILKASTGEELTRLRTRWQRP